MKIFGTISQINPCTKFNLIIWHTHHIQKKPLINFPKKMLSINYFVTVFDVSQTIVHTCGNQKKNNAINSSPIWMSELGWNVYLTTCEAIYSNGIEYNLFETSLLTGKSFECYHSGIYVLMHFWVRGVQTEKKVLQM